MPRLAEGETVAGYRVAMFIAGGGMGEVYRATDVESGRPVALKLLAGSGDGRFAERFDRERAIAATLDHPRIVPVYDTGVDETGRAYIAMRLVEGRDLTSLLREGPLSVARSLAILAQVAEALDAAHDRGLVHRDVKPGNILLEARSDGGDDVFLSDFGLVKELVVDDGVSGTGAVLGTPDYMPPEIMLSGSSDARGDVYALGCVLFEMLAGRPPFQRGSEVATIWAHVNDDPPSLLELAPGLPAGLDPVVARALAKEPEERYASAGDLAAAAVAAASGVAFERTRRPVSDAELCPYKGLASFDEADASFFFGREELVAQLVPRLREAGFLAVVGASGSGKSSLVRAGLLPALGEPASVITPGERPLEALAAATPATVLVVDQFEELFTLCGDEAERDGFVGSLLSVPDDVVIVVRADFYDRCLAYPELASLLERSQAAVGPMSEEALRRAITKPAQRVGLHLEHRLLESVVHDVAGQPGALPLLSHALLETWNRRVGRTLTLAGYLEAGGVEGALARTAQALYDEHDAADRRLLRGMFLRLTTLGEGTEDTRRRVAFAELVLSTADEARIHALVQRLVDARLVTVDGASVEVAHEALIRHWPTLRAWLLEDRDGRRVHRRITESAQEWLALDRDPGALLRGARLAPVAEWAEVHDEELNKQEREFVAASRAAEERELADVRRRNRRLRTLVVALAVLLAVAAAAAVVAVRQTGEAQDQQAAARAQASEATAQQQRAEEQARVALSRGLAGQAQTLLTRRLDQALLLALEANRTTQTDEAREALVAAVQRTRGLEAILSGDMASARTLAISDDGRLVIVGNAAGVVSVWDAERREQVGEPFQLTATGARAGLAHIALSPDRSHVLGLTDDGAIWLARLGADHQVRRIAPTVEDVYYGGHRWESAAFSANGDEILAVSGLDSSGARLSYVMRRAWWLVPGPERRNDAPAEAPTRTGVVLSPDAATLAIADPDGVAFENTVTRASRGRVQARVARREGRPLLVLSRGGRLLAAVEVGGAVGVWDVRGRRRLTSVAAHSSDVTALAFTPDGSRLALGLAGGGIVIYDARSGAQIGLPLEAHAGDVVSLAVGAPRTRIASIGTDGLLLLLGGDGDSALTRVVASERRASDIAVSPDGHLLAIAHTDGRVASLDLDARTSRPYVRVPRGNVSVAFSPDGSTLAVLGGDSHLVMWDVASWRRRATSFDAFSGRPLVFSPTGAAVAAAGRAGTGDLDIWQRGAERTVALVASLPLRPLDVAFAPDGRRVAVAYTDGTVRIRDVTRPDAQGTILELHRGPVSGAAYSPDGQTLVSVGRDGIVRFSPVDGPDADGTELSGGGGALLGVDFVGDVVQTLGVRGLRYWDAQQRTPLGGGVDLGPVDGPARVAVPVRGGSVVVLWRGRVVRLDDLLWTSDRARLAGRVCALVGRSLTTSELAQFEPGAAGAPQCAGRRPLAVSAAAPTSAR